MLGMRRGETFLATVAADADACLVGVGGAGECAAGGLLCWNVCGRAGKGVRLRERQVTVAKDVLDVSLKCAWPVLCCMA